MRDPGNPRDLCLYPAIRRRSGSNLRSAAGLVVDTTARMDKRARAGENADEWARTSTNADQVSGTGPSEQARALPTIFSFLSYINKFITGDGGSSSERDAANEHRANAGNRQAMGRQRRSERA